MSKAPLNNREDGDQYISSYLKTISELTTRVDERVQMIIKKQDDMERKIERFHEIELRVQAVESNSSRGEARWKTTIGFALQVAWVMLAAYLLYKVGLQAPAVP